MPSTESTRAAGAGVFIAAVVVTALLIRSPEEKRSSQIIIPGFTNEASALAVSRAAMQAAQNEATRNDPETGTLFLFGVEEALGGGEWGLVVDIEHTNRLSAEQLNRTVSRGERGDKWNKPDPVPPTTPR